RVTHASRSENAFIVVHDTAAAVLYTLSLHDALPICDGSDIIEGQGGHDTMLFNGANIAEKIDISANGSRVRFTRDVANIVMDLRSEEHTSELQSLAYVVFRVKDVTGTDVTEVNLDLA